MLQESFWKVRGQELLPAGYMAWITSVTIDAILGDLSGVAVLILVAAGIIGTGALTKATPSPFKRE